jgi:CheY-like chemotaxis protein
MPAVLIVEDEWLVRAEIVNEFQRAGWKVHESSTGEGALALLRAGQRVDVLITDIQLAGYLSGWDVAEAFRADCAEMPIIYTSANSPESARRVPGSAFLDKPCNSTELLKACRRLVRSDAADT